ncbi:MAG: FGGY-family carbohydrate kinase, partial [Chloroflexota bacterium]
LSTAERLAGQPAEEVRVAGGGARLQFWSQIKADVTGRPLRPCATTENGVLGAAMLAALGAGLYPDVSTAGTAMVQLEATIPPNPDHRAVYDRAFERYLALYPRLSDVLGA